ncbi:hypothetical protein KCV01_g23886, partial [Aureobasidium melanogenum]
LAERQAADDRQTQRPTQLGSGAATQQHRQRTEHRRQRRHQDGPETQQARLEDRVGRCLPVRALTFQREVHDHDRVLLHDADEQHDADDADHVQVVSRDHEGQQGADASGR